ncbi:hypothetical protein [Streptomyces sp. NPDC090022]|uniref:hypothetical protein n=1 Tax=Streptomyces sp. NPDC090022 TaxID=3365920 RepID=UPI00380EC93A
MRTTTTLRTGYWFEAVCYRDVYDDRPRLLHRAMLDTPEQAVRLVGSQIRAARPVPLTAAEIERALAWAAAGGRVAALAALHRGEPAGFSIVLRDGLRPEWRVVPVSYVDIAAPACRSPMEL